MALRGGSFTTQQATGGPARYLLSTQHSALCTRYGELHAPVEFMTRAELPVPVPALPFPTPL